MLSFLVVIHLSSGKNPTHIVSYGHCLHEYSFQCYLEFIILNVESDVISKLFVIYFSLLPLPKREM